MKSRSLLFRTVERFYYMWENSPRYSRYVDQEIRLNALFKKDDTNGNIDIIFAKVCALDTCYSTHILAPVVVANRIKELILLKEKGLYQRLKKAIHLWLWISQMAPI